MAEIPIKIGFGRECRDSRPELEKMRLHLAAKTPLSVFEHPVFSLSSGNVHRNMDCHDVDDEMELHLAVDLLDEVFGHPVLNLSMVTCIETWMVGTETSMALKIRDEKQQGWKGAR